MATKASILRSSAAAFVAALVSACASYPRPPNTTWGELFPASDLPGENLGSAIVAGCGAEPIEHSACQLRIADLTRAVKSTGLFRHVSEPTRARGEAAWTIVALDAQRARVKSPVENPAKLLLSLVFPIWWSEPGGYAFSVTDAASGQAIRIDTTWEGTVVAWGAAPLLSVFPNRTIYRTRAAETARLRRALEELSAPTSSLH